MTDTHETAIRQALQKNAAMVAGQVLERNIGNVSLLRQVGELCRQGGALDEARQIFERIIDLAPDDAKAHALCDILNQRPSRDPPAPDEAWPAKFVQIVEFLPAEAHAKVVSTTLHALSRFVPSEILADGHGHLDASQRVSSILAQSQVSILRDLFLPYLESALINNNVPEILGINRGLLRGRREFQVTCSGSGAFFKAHTDSGKEANRSRQISFVYYFNEMPKRFNGGSLLIFDSAPKIERFSTQSYTRIEPINNSMVVFPSSSVHEVESVQTETGSLAEGRFTLNGWISAKAEDLDSFVVDNAG